jgi:hypothetical protein
MLLLVDKLPSAAVFLMHATACLCFVGVRSPARVKTLLGVADADHSDTCGCQSLLGGVFLGQSRPPPFVLGETLGPFCWTGQQRRFGVVPFLKALCWLRGVLWLSEMVASPVFCEAGWCVSDSAQDVRLWGNMYAIVRTL